VSVALRRGVAAGLAGGAAMALFLLAVGERTIAAAIALEEASARAADEPFSRAQQLAGAIGGILVFGVAVGVIFAVMFVAARHRMPGDDWHRSLALAAAGFTVVFLVPFLKYPSNPPGVGDPHTIARRGALHVAVLMWSLAAGWGAWRLWCRLRDRGTAPHRRGPASTLAFVAVVAAGFVLLPGSPDSIGAPAVLVWRFRLASLGGAACFWAVLGVTHGWLSLPRAGAPVLAPLPRSRGS
jgi:predicted cobalt transporter CbtA